MRRSYSTCSRRRRDGLRRRYRLIGWSGFDWKSGISWRFALPSKFAFPRQSGFPWLLALPRQLAAALALMILFCGLAGSSCAPENRYPGPLEPEEALASFRLDSSFTIGVFASEPMIMDPVEMVFDRKGNIYVVEMEDYPFKPEPEAARGRIRLLRDSDGDGKADNSVLFADGLSEATSVLPWKDGLIVTTAPYIFYLKDTTGDGRADTREALFSGFFENNSEAQITNLLFGVDNWIYASNNGQPGEVSFSGKPDAPPVSVRGADFRFRLDKGLFEPETGSAQFGQAINDWGHRFLTQNTIHIQQAVIPWRYLHRHPYLPSDRAATDISDHGLRMFQQTPAPYWRAERTRRRQREYQERGLDRVEYAGGHFTGASGGTLYTGDAFPPEFYGSLFTGDVSGNLVHRDVLLLPENSAVYSASRGEADREREFLSSTDPWFRPVNFTAGPDGALYIIDMYRQHIETPVSIPADLKKDMDFMAGSDRGRIYRVLPRQEGPGSGPIEDGLSGNGSLAAARSSASTSPRLDTVTSASLVNLLKHPNRWWRLQAQQLLLERGDKSAVTGLKTLFGQGKNASTRLHALYALEGLDGLSAGLVRQALNDAHPGVREHGLILAERFPECLPEVKEKATDPAARVVLQACLSLGAFPAEEAAPVLVEILEQHMEDPWFRMAVLSSEAGSSAHFLDLLAGRSFFHGPSPGKTRFLEDFAFIAAARAGTGEISHLLTALPEEKGDEWKLAALNGIARGLARNEDRAATVSRLRERFIAWKEQAQPEAARLIGKILEE